MQDKCRSAPARTAGGGVGREGAGRLRGRPALAWRGPRPGPLSSHPAPPFFNPRSVPLPRDVTPLQSPGPRTGLAADFFTVVLDFHLRGFEGRLQAVAQLLAGDEAVLRLRTLTLAAHLQAAGQVPQHHGGAGLVDLLPARPAAANERLLQILLTDAEFLHAGAQGVVFRQIGHA